MCNKIVTLYRNLFSNLFPKSKQTNKLTTPKSIYNKKYIKQKSRVYFSKKNAVHY